jgi:uncharacterized membrane protein
MFSAVLATRQRTPTAAELPQLSGERSATNSPHRVNTASMQAPKLHSSHVCDRILIFMSAVIILGFTIIAGTVIGLAILHLAHEVIISRLHSGPVIGHESVSASGSLLSTAASQQSAAN